MRVSSYWKIALTPFLLVSALAFAQEVNLYSSMADKDLRTLIAEFEQRSGIRVNVWRSTKERIARRVISEARAGRYEVDVIHNASPEMEALHRERLLRPVDSPLHQELIPQAVAPHREWAGPRVYLYVQAYNTRVVTQADLPRTYADLLAPRWKGRVAIESKEQEWFHALVQSMGEAEGLKYFRALAANGLQLRRIDQAMLTKMVISGDVPLALALYSDLPDEARRKGAPIARIELAPTIATTDAIGIAARAPHPDAARKLYDFMLSDGLMRMAQIGHLVSRRGMAPELERLQVRFIDPTADYDRWTQIFEDTINER